MKAFNRCSGLRTITIPDEVTYIGVQAFRGCVRLQSVRLPDKLETIEDGAFEYCYALSHITIPEQVRTIGKYAFKYCSLTEVTIPHSVERIGKEAFTENHSYKNQRWQMTLTSVTIHSDTIVAMNRNSSISDHTICHLFGEQVNEYIIGDGVKSIGDYAFSFSKYLKRGEYLKKVVIPNSVTRIGSGAFGSQEALTDITIPRGLKELGDWVFMGCKSLASVHIPYGVTQIRFGVFRDCAALSEITIPASVTRIDYHAFQGCTSLQTVEIPDGVTHIGDNAFEGCQHLASVTIPSTVQTIGKEAFKGCDKLTAINLPQSVKTGQNAFASHTKVTRVKNEVLEAQHVKADPKALPILEIVSGSMAFIDASGDNIIKANSSYRIRFMLKNTGKGVAKGCTTTVSGKGSMNDIQVKSTTLPAIAVGETKAVELAITTGTNTVDGEVELAIRVDEPNGFGTDPQYITVKTQAFEEPRVQVTDYSLTADGGTTLKKKVPFDLQLLVQNTKHGQADDVHVTIDIPQNVLIIDGNAHEQFAHLVGGETRSLVYSLIVNNNYVGNTIPIAVHVKECTGKYGEDRTIQLQLDQAMASTKISVDARQQPKADVAIARLGSDVDKDLPQAAGQLQKTFAVIIANEHYQTVEGVPFAQNDGLAFEAYCQQTLGIPQQNIHLISDATLNGMKYQVDWLRQVMEAYNGEARAIVYYAGHGIPSEQDQTAYLLPVDGYTGNTSSAYSLSEFYRTLGSLPARSVTVFLDACFSGTKRDGQMLASARGVAIKAKTSNPQGNMIVFSAAQGDETAYPYQDQHHGMFTYYILKKLKDSKGNTTLGSLSDYVSQEVKRQSIVLNGKMQTPNVTASENMGQTWRNMTLK